MMTKVYHASIIYLVVDNEWYFRSCITTNTRIFHKMLQCYHVVTFILYIPITNLNVDDKPFFAYIFVIGKKLLSNI